VVQEFKDFIAKGGVFEAAVGLVMALAFIPVVDALISGVLMPIIAAIVGEPNFDGIVLGIGDAEILIGTVITQVINFIAIGFVVFLMVKAYNKFNASADEDGPSDNDLLAQIRDSLAR